MDFFAQDPAFFMNIGIVGMMIIMFYFLIIRPQKKADRERDNFQSSLKKGAKVITVGGIYGVITSIGDQKATLEIADNVEIELTRSAIGRYQDSNKQEMVATGKK